MSQSLLIADACVIMDHGYIGGLQWLTQLGRAYFGAKRPPVSADGGHRFRPSRPPISEMTATHFGERGRPTGYSLNIAAR